MLFSTDEYCERLFLRDEEVFAEDGEIFDLLASKVSDLHLSAIPLGIQVQLCDRILGSRGELHARTCAVFNNSQEHGLTANLSIPIFPPADDSSGDPLREFFIQSLDVGEKLLEPLRMAGRLIEIDRSIYDDIAYLTFRITLFDQTFSDAEAFITEINDRVSNAYTPPNLFVCHASEDKSFVDRLVSDLDRRAMFAWYDKREIFVGDSIVEKINNALKATDYLIAVLSPRSVSKPWVVREMSSSLMRQIKNDGINILPVLLEPCDVPSLLADLKYADFTGSFEKGINELITAIRKKTKMGQP